MTPRFQLVQLRNGSWSIRDLEVAETYHPVVGPAAEADALYVRQLRIADRLRAVREEPFVVWDVGLGAAANPLAVAHSVRAETGRLRVLSFDHTLEPLRFALRHAGCLQYLHGFEAGVRNLLDQGQSTFRSGAVTVDWTLHLGDFPTVLHGPEAPAWPAPNAILFDAFSPARNPSMWTLPLLTRLRLLAHEASPCALATYSRATLVRVSLLRAGWIVGVGCSTGEKDETTVAANQASLVERPLDDTWLLRAMRSCSAEPMTTVPYVQAPMSPATREALRDHPQFAGSAIRTG
ncbi:MAG: methyltransferase [Verrucomicrobiae bacterium]|nr:methyltransferase [Verrucomicrobiae bacterium]